MFRDPKSPQLRAFLIWAVAYSVLTARRLDWIMVIAGPLAITAALFTVSALQTGRAAARRV